MTPMRLEYLNGFSAVISPREDGSLDIAVSAAASGRSWQAARPTIEEAILLARRIASEQRCSERWLRRLAASAKRRAA